MPNYHDDAKQVQQSLEKISGTMCMAKWLQVSLHLPQGLTQSCYHPPAEKIPLIELDANIMALHNTKSKISQRQQMRNGERPSGCSYCWKIEDAPNGPHLSDRHYRSSEWWVKDQWKEVSVGDVDETVTPAYMEVNFNQACNLKCIYCSPHLSSSWEKEIISHGPVQLDGNASHNNIEYLDAAGLMPLKLPNSQNPYIKAFWQWWPTAYKSLKIFRMTGGEPLMDKNTFKILEYVNENPKFDLELSITSNLSPPDDDLMEKFINAVQALERPRIWSAGDAINPDSGNEWSIAPAVRHFSVFVSVDTVGAQAEYIRSNLNYDYMMMNVRRIMNDTNGTEITFINTFNLLSIPKLKDFLKMILDLRVEFGYENQQEHVIPIPDHNGKKHPPFIRKRQQRIWFDVPYLEYPNWLSAQNAAYYPQLLSIIDECINFMKLNVEDEHYGRTYHGFKTYEIAKMERNRAWISTGMKSINNSEMNQRRRNFWKFTNQLDTRRNTNFPETFPELSSWWNDCSSSSNGSMEGK